MDKHHLLLWNVLMSRMAKLLSTQNGPSLLYNYNDLTRLTCVTMSDGRVAIGNVKNPIRRWAIGDNKFLRDLVSASDTEPEGVLVMLANFSRQERQQDVFW